MAKHLKITKNQIEQFKELKIEGSIQMLNLLKFKKSVEGKELSGADQYKLYMKAAYPFFVQANAKVLYYGKALFGMIGPEDEQEWDEVLIVEYNSKADFVKMAMNPDYPSELRDLALVDSRLVLMQSNQ